MKISMKPSLMVLGSMVLAFFLWTLVSALGGSAVSRRAEQPIHLPRPEEIGQVLPALPPSAQPVSPAAGHRQESSVVSGTRVSNSSRVSSSGGLLIPPAQEVQKLQEEGGIIY